MTVSELKANFSSQLSDLYTASENAFIFQMFAQNILELNTIQQRQLADQEISSENEEKFSHIISELKTGRPYLQILGETEFYGMKFFVDENVLIPRPETEELLEIAIREIKKIQSTQVLKILDIGTGSGIIPLVLKKCFPEAEVSSIDFSEKALKTAKKNADYHQLSVNFIHADYLHFELQEKYDIIISNPPYIGIEEEIEIADSVKEFEPKMALFSPTADALIFYRKIAEDAREHLNDSGLLFLEINQKLGPETLELYQDFSDAQLLKDLSENDRFIYGKK
ncbi:peptide chain release factor N(5)-glutamine methyltransferase [Chryseobacterium arthrosphaerae]|uniref:peptide chain release factor N(5)-glutamine methyltransferase n=1 Tax=Chryseobacterium arthrosphaerae TaxID=651561 RepID=UPI001F4BA492|nr:peptide chain release factor N(5)-glutamine methyltransferase [Chryseobacterium arthrosphaerae]MDG4652457.1 peptide chain release factor N(5)-glutamine methyltransferase [Chryseobacterium arthrosphaerae]